MNKEFVKSYLKVIGEDQNRRELTIKYDDQEYDVIVKNLYFNPVDRSVGIFEPEENDEFIIAISDALIKRDHGEEEYWREKDEEY